MKFQFFSAINISTAVFCKVAAAACNVS